jgi:asparagine N-glycosylation enzyme membrane subunit Stt3
MGAEGPRNTFLLHTVPGLLLVVVCVGAWRLRWHDPHEIVFTPGAVVARGYDPWYHLRVIDSLVRNFPQRLTFDPYARFPGGQEVGFAPLFDLVAAVPAWLAGEGWVDPWASILPALLGALIPWPVFLLGRALLGPWPGLLAAAVVATAPGHLLHVTVAGFADHHGLEVLLSVLVLLFWPRWQAGMFLGLYLLSWQGGAVLVGILLLWLMLEPERSRAAAPPFAVAAAVLLPFLLYGPVVHRQALAVLAALGASYLRLRLPLALAVAAILALVVSAAGGHVSLTGYFSRGPSVWELRPLLFATGSFSIAPAIEEFGHTTWLILPGLVIAMRQRSLFVVWSVAWLAATLLMRRHAYYFAVNAALLAACCCAYLGQRSRWAGALVGLLVALSNIPPAIAKAAAVGGPSLAWRDAMDWMRRNTPEPLGSPDAYYAVHATPFRYPGSAYGVMVWGAQGWWVARMAHRIPNDNPTWVGSHDAAAFYLAQDEAAAGRILHRLGSRYVIAPFSVPLQENAGGASAYGEFAVMANWIRRDRREFVELFHFPDGRRKLLYYANYFQTMAARLCVFGGRAAESVRPALVTFRRSGADNVVTYYEEFPDYARAVNAAARRTGARLVSSDPLRTCVPLARLDKFREVYHSSQPWLRSAPVESFEIRIYEYTR